MKDASGNFSISRPNGRRAWKAAFAYAAALIFVLGMSLVRNGLVGGGWVLATSNGPILLYIGNAPDSMGIFHYPESFFALEAKYGDRSAVPWTRELLAATMENPWRFFQNLARKTVLFFNAYEIADNANYYLLGRFSPLVRYNPVGWQLIVALGFVGGWLTRHRWREQVILYVYSAIFAASIIVVFVVGRYRLEFLLPMAVWAGAAVTWLGNALSQRAWRRACVSAGATLALIVILDMRWSPALAWNSPPNVSGLRPIRPNDFTLLARAYLEAKQLDKVQEILAEGFAQHPWDQTLAKHLARVLESNDRFDAAANVLRRYLSFMSGDLEMACELARVLSRSGNGGEAKKIVEKVLKIDPSYERARKLQEKLQP
ncbi:MAG: tetratricopeptide repeat protein [Candidatus Sumerlaeaceae bacterium]|nr:tetratricopeptide repeat protein [Candidatus Sumerlaeaceae bacterium]